MGMDNVQVEVISAETIVRNDLDAVIFELDQQIDLLSSQADKWDYLISVASGILCGMLDVLWVGDFSLQNGRYYASDKINSFATKAANLLGFKGDDTQAAVRFLEKSFPLPSDGNMNDFGGTLQHHLRDFSHHPTIAGLFFSILTQFTGVSYGTDVNGNFIIPPVPAASQDLIGNSIPEKLFRGTVVWFFHLISDMAGSGTTAGLSGGTGIPGPILSLAKEISAIPAFKNTKVGEFELSKFLSKVFNGTLFAEHDEAGRIIKDTVCRFDLRGELGVLAELGKQAIPVIANDCIVRAFYFIRRLILAIKQLNCTSLSDLRLKDIDWASVKPFGNPTVTRMLTISSAVFSTIDIGEAIISRDYFVAVNYVGVGRFLVAIGAEIRDQLKVRDVRRIKEVYETIRRNTYTETDNRIYERIGEGMSGESLDIGKFCLTLKQTEILYNIEYLKTNNDILRGGPKIELKRQWLDEWKQYIENGFSSFTGEEGAKVHWYSYPEIVEAVRSDDPDKPWFRLLLLEAMLFEPYYPLGTETDKKGNVIPSTKYKDLQSPLWGYSKSSGDSFLENFFTDDYYQKGYIARLRKCYEKVIRELNEVLKGALKAVAIGAATAIVIIATAGALAPQIAVALVGANFAGLHGAALTATCLAYLGGGAVAAGGLGVAGGTMAIVGGGALLGLGVGTGVSGAIGTAEVLGKKDTILQSAKLMVSVREIFLNDEHDIEYSNTVYEQYVRKIADIEKGLVELRLKADTADKEEKKQLEKLIKNAEESVDAMKIAMKSMKKFNSSFALGDGMTN